MVNNTGLISNYTLTNGTLPAPVSAPTMSQLSMYWAKLQLFYSGVAGWVHSRVPFLMLFPFAVLGFVVVMFWLIRKLTK